MAGAVTCSLFPILASSLLFRTHVQFRQRRRCHCATTPRWPTLIGFTHPASDGARFTYRDTASYATSFCRRLVYSPLIDSCLGKLAVGLQRTLCPSGGGAFVMPVTVA
ncbi:hypothetical protein OG21DRAFT_653661 [Imleria badia]|nr:hypothetical protein OG21DRAFT_653661 [Imleria badia]